MEETNVKPRTYIDMVQEAEEIASEQFDDMSQEVAWVQAKETHLNMLCAYEIIKNQQSF